VGFFLKFCGHRIFDCTLQYLVKLIEYNKSGGGLAVTSPPNLSLRKAMVALSAPSTTPMRWGGDPREKRPAAALARTPMGVSSMAGVRPLPAPPQNDLRHTDERARGPTHMRAHTHTHPHRHTHAHTDTNTHTHRHRHITTTYLRGSLNRVLVTLQGGLSWMSPGTARIPVPLDNVSLRGGLRIWGPTKTSW